MKEKTSKLSKVPELVSIRICIVIKGCLNIKLLLYLLYHPILLVSLESHYAIKMTGSHISKVKTLTNSGHLFKNAHLNFVLQGHSTLFLLFINNLLQGPIKIASKKLKDESKHF